LSAAETCNLSNFYADAMARINALRAKGANCGTMGQFAPAPALTWSPKLAQSALRHSNDMATKVFFSHTGSDGSTLGPRVTDTGYLWNLLGENIAAGQFTVNLAMDDWTDSDGHCANLMNPSFTEVGLVCVASTVRGSYGNYWTMDLGRPR
jgi:uncharacterized protein YkwD